MYFLVYDSLALGMKESNGPFAGDSALDGSIRCCSLYIHVDITRQKITEKKQIKKNLQSYTTDRVFFGVGGGGILSLYFSMIL